MKNRAARAKQRNAVESFKNAAETIGPCTRGMSLFCITRGQWSMIDAVLHTLECVGRARVTLWTWTIADYEVQCLTRLREDKRVSDALLVVDYAYRLKDRRGAPILRDWRRSFGPESIRYCKNHAKIATVETADDIELYLDTWMDWQEAQENIQRCGNVVKHPRTGSPIPNPYINIKAQAAVTLRRNDTLKVKRLWLARA